MADMSEGSAPTTLTWAGRVDRPTYGTFQARRPSRVTVSGDGSASGQTGANNSCEGTENGRDRQPLLRAGQFRLPPSALTAFSTTQARVRPVVTLSAESAHT